MHMSRAENARDGRISRETARIIVANQRLQWFGGIYGCMAPKLTVDILSSEA